MSGVAIVRLALLIVLVIQPLLVSIVDARPATPDLGSSSASPSTTRGKSQISGGAGIDAGPGIVPPSSTGSGSTSAGTQAAPRSGDASPAAPNPTIVVNSFMDAVDVAPGNHICETGPGNGVCTLRAAIQEANAQAGADNIQLAAGTYQLTIPGRGELLAAQGDLNITDSLAIIGVGASDSGTIVDGGAIDRVFRVNEGVSLTMNGLIVQNGNTGFSSTVGDGAGILNFGALSLTNVVIRGNHAVGSAALGGGYGGGIGHYRGSLTMLGSVVQNNVADANGGGIAHNNLTGSSIPAVPMTLTNVAISMNSALGTSNGVGAGGGIISGGNDDTTVGFHGGFLTSNTAAFDGGAIALDFNATLTLDPFVSNPGPPIVQIVPQVLNNRSGSSGGGIASYGTATVKSAILNGNQADDFGGALVSLGDGDMIVIATNDAGTIVAPTLISNGTAGAGGGGFAVVSPTNSGGASLSIANTTVTGNQSTEFGGGGFVGEASTLALDSVTVNNNAAKNGGGLAAVHTGAVVTLLNTTVSSNAASLAGGGILLGDLAPGGLDVMRKAMAASHLTLASTTIAFNAASQGGGLANGTSTLNSGVVDARNTIFAKSTLGSDCTGPLNSVSHNLVQNFTGCVISGDLGSLIQGLDPLLGPLANNGGPTLTHIASVLSPVLDTGDPAAPGGGPPACPAIDQRGISRDPANGYYDGNGDNIRGCDIGAVENHTATGKTHITAPPPAGAVIHTRKPTFSWDKHTNSPTFYFVYDIDTNGTPDVIQAYPVSGLGGICPAPTPTTCSVQSPVYLTAGTHDLLVDGFNDLGWGVFNDPYIYCIITCDLNTLVAPPAPGQLGPSHTSANPPTFTWSALPDEPIAYWVVDAGPGGIDVNQVLTDVNALCPPNGITSPCAYTAGGNLAVGVHDWYVAAGNERGWGPFAGPMRYCIGSVCDAAPGAAAADTTPTATSTPTTPVTTATVTPTSGTTPTATATPIVATPTATPGTPSPTATPVTPTATSTSTGMGGSGSSSSGGASAATATPTATQTSPGNSSSPLRGGGFR